MRPNETNGVDYYFVSDDEFKQMLKEDKFIEYRKYNTLVNNQSAIWYYGLSKTPLDSDKQHVVILDIQGTIDFIKWYGKEYCNVILITCDDNIRRERAKLRGGYDETEFNRRLEDDKRVFGIENMRGLINYYIDNNGTLADLQLKVKDLLDNINSSMIQ
jgi:guanylate kinase